MRWPLQVTLMDTLPVGVELDDRVGATAPTDGITIGRTVPGGTYHWFFPVGVRSVVRGRRDDDLQLALSATSTAWVPASESRPLPAGTPRPHAVMSSLTTSPQADRVVLRIPLSERIPYQVEETRDGLHVVLYGASGDADWTRLAPGDSLIRAATWWQRTTDELVVDVALAPPLWGWRIRYEGSDLLLEIRRPPAVDARAPLRGRRIVIDPGHPPAGATGPTGLREADANLAIALAIVPLLEAEGAQVLLTRVRDTSIDLWPRVQFAERAGADLLVSIHNNALPDGVNPFTNNGTSTFYNHLNSLPLAIAVQRALTASLGLRDLGVARGDLALVRGSWVPSVMCEGMFVIVPEQEEALRSEAGQQRYAAGVVAGLRAFLAGLGRGTPRS
jgi:N-acetylmuramoyl-L-alanine amidase